MEDIAAGIFRVIVIAIVIISVVSRNKRQRAAGRGGDSEERPAEMPWDVPRHDMTPTPGPTVNEVPAPAQQQPRKPRPTNVKKAVIESVTPSQRRPVAEAEAGDAEAMAAEYYRSRGDYKSLRKTATPVAAAQQKAAVAAEAAGESDMAKEAETDDVTTRFNLRDAVLYSEILKPKFDE